MDEDEVFKHLDEVEARTIEKTSRVFRTFLGGALTLDTLGEMYGWWGKHAGEIINELREIWFDSYHLFRDAGVIERTSLDGLELYMAKVNDRLVRGLEPPIAEDSFDKVRGAIVMGAANGWGRQRTAEEIAARLSWEKDDGYWRKTKADVDEQIDSILDPLGEPGNPAREYAKLHDPRVNSLRSERNLATKHLDAEGSYWQERAVKIARTESTGAYNGAAMAALHDEGWAFKRWLATPDHRTRPTHRAADGQVVALLSPFRVGDSLLMMPGDPLGTPGEVINCRCAIIGSDSAEQQKPVELGLVAAAAGFDPLQARVPKGNGHLSGRWIDMPGTIIDQLFAEVPNHSSAMIKAKELVDQGRDDPFSTESAALFRSAGTRLKLAGEDKREPLAGSRLTDFAGIDWYSDIDNPPEISKAPEVEAPAAIPSAPVVNTPKPLNSGQTDLPGFSPTQPEDPDIALTKANPFWGDAKDADEKGNCQLSVLAWELRCRGYDVAAKLGHPQPPWDNGIFDWFEMSVAGSYERPKDPMPEVGRKNQIAKSVAGIRRSIDAAISEHPAGSRGFLGWYGGGKYSTAGHIVSWYKDDAGVTHLVDPQSGAPVTDNELTWLHTFTTSRLDDKDINSTAASAVTGPDGKGAVYVPRGM